jgi:methionyl aminopeptidase
MITAGSPDVFVHEDQWSISSADGSLAAHFEHSIAISESGPIILTAAPDVDLARIAGLTAA